MKTLGILILTGVVFAATATAAWWVKSTQNAAVQSSETESAETSNLEFNRTSQESNSPESLLERVADIDANPQPISVEELVRLGMNLKQREQKLEKQEEDLRQQSIHQQIAFAEIQAETKAIDELRSSVRGELDKAESLVSRLIQARQAVIDEKATAKAKLAEVQNVLTEVDGQHLENTKKLAQWIQSMDAEKAAEVLREMSNDGKMEIAVQILAHLGEREAAKILSELNDAKLVQDLVTEFRNLKSPKQVSREKSSSR